MCAGTRPSWWGYQDEELHLEMNRSICSRRGYASETTGMKRGYKLFREFVTDDLKIKKIDTLVGLVESVDAGVAENAKRLWLGETPTANSVGRPSDKGGGTTIKEKNDTNHVLACLKRDHPDLTIRASIAHCHGGHARE